MAPRHTVHEDEGAALSPWTRTIRFTDPVAPRCTVRILPQSPYVDGLRYTTSVATVRQTVEGTADTELPDQKTSAARSSTTDTRRTARPAHCDNGRGIPRTVVRTTGTCFHHAARRLGTELRIGCCQYAHDSSIVPDDYYQACLEVCSFGRAHGNREGAASHDSSNMKLVALLPAKCTELAMHRTYGSARHSFTSSPPNTVSQNHFGFDDADCYCAEEDASEVKAEHPWRRCRYALETPSPGNYGTPGEVTVTDTTAAFGAAPKQPSACEGLASYALELPGPCHRSPGYRRWGR